MNWLLWAFCLLIVSAFLYLSAASMLGTFLKQRRAADDQIDAEFVASCRRFDKWARTEASARGLAPDDYEAILRNRGDQAQ